MDKEILYTIGHSNQSQEKFLELIKDQEINCIIDVRSVPYSEHTPQFNKEVLKSFLNKDGILYAHFGNEFGARRADCFQEVEFVKRRLKEIKRQVDFEQGIKTQNFLKGVERLKKALLQGWHVSLMCSEANPIDCHRFSFISRYFYEKLGWDVRHIIKDESNGKSMCKSHKELEAKMILEYVSNKKLLECLGQGDPKLSLGDDYTERQQRIDAYRLKNREIGYIDNEQYELID